MPARIWLLERADSSPDNEQHSARATLGACCLSDGTCVDGTTIVECGLLGGWFSGFGIRCPEGCPELLELQPLQACCLESEGCVELDADACAARGGTSLGSESSCDDIDGDGVDACGDACPFDSGKIEEGACGCGEPDTDSDGDGTPDCIDNCLNDSGKTDPGECGCGVSDIDTDGDGTLDCRDNCPNDPGKTEPGECGCGVPDTDSDGDGTPDCLDNCPDDPGKTEPGACGCGVADTDSDGDGTPDCLDNCPDDPGKTDPGACGCGVADTDSDGDGTPDCLDNCPDDPGKTEQGECGCGVPDTDTDGDGTPDCLDNCPNDPDKTEPGECGCDESDTDTDDDGVFDCVDNCVAIDNPGQEDCDDDGVGDHCAGEPDCNANGVPDSCDIANATSSDANANGTPDECEGFRLETGTAVVGGHSVHVPLSGFIDPVVVCTVSYDANTLPVVVRVHSVDHFGFDVRLQNPSNSAVVAETVHWVAMEAGTWTIGGVICEAWTMVSSVNDHSPGTWNGQVQSYTHDFTQPVVLGQVMTENDDRWSVFWARGSSFADPPSATVLRIGKAVGEDHETDRLEEVLGVMVFEQQHGVLGSHVFDAVVSDATVSGLASGTYAVAFESPFAAVPEVALLSSAGMHGTNGGWPVLAGAAPLTTTEVVAGIDEDQIGDEERGHINENVASVTFSTSGAWAEPAAAGTDVNRDGVVDDNDLAALIAAVGTICPGLCEGDLDFDGAVTLDDVALFVAVAW